MVEECKYWITRYGTVCDCRMVAEFIERHESQDHCATELSQVLGLDLNVKEHALVFKRLFYKLPEVKAVLEKY